ncbi:hypothetical protein KIPB_004643 [Kipferlia bialata]|uniref:RRM domain-containing protein n=1 Tax=Kipferlia bialata TaxID=797122 RepID=A0A9K3GHL3_9EUKA|nr:hypothetical protein KIPB_004643 [Kipferlia bialata]|eukprot:g4643.t1
MSRVIVKNLPVQADEKALKALFSPYGSITDCYVKRRPDGKSRRYAFIGFNDEEAAARSVKELNSTYMRSQKIEVQVATAPVRQAPQEGESNGVTVSGEGFADAGETGRLKLYHLPVSTDSGVLRRHFEKYGPVSDTHIIIDPVSEFSTGSAFVQFMLPEHAVKALSESHIIGGKIIRLTAALAPRESDDSKLTYKQRQKKQRLNSSADQSTWNTLHTNKGAMTSTLASRLGVSKEDLLSENAAVRMATGEARLARELGIFLESRGIEPDPDAESVRSKTTVLCKNIPEDVSPDDIEAMFSKHAAVSAVYPSPGALLTIVEMADAQSAKVAFRRLAFTPLGKSKVPLYLEWAAITDEARAKARAAKRLERAPKDNPLEMRLTNRDASTPAKAKGALKLVIRNIAFQANAKELRQLLSSFGELKTMRAPKRQNGELRGFGFAEYTSVEDAAEAAKMLNGTHFYGRHLVVEAAEDKKDEDELLGKHSGSSNVKSGKRRKH